MPLVRASTHASHVYEEKARNGFLRCDQRSFGPSRGTKLWSEKKRYRAFFSLFYLIKNTGSSCSLQTAAAGSFICRFGGRGACPLEHIQ